MAPLLSDLTVRQLRERAAARRIPGRSSMNKAQLVTALRRRPIRASGGGSDVEFKPVFLDGVKVERVFLNGKKKDLNGNETKSMERLSSNRFAQLDGDYAQHIFIMPDQPSDKAVIYMRLKGMKGEAYYAAWDMEGSDLIVKVSDATTLRPMTAAGNSQVQRFMQSSAEQIANELDIDLSKVGDATTLRPMTAAGSDDDSDDDYAGKMAASLGIDLRRVANTGMQRQPARPYTAYNVRSNTNAQQRQRPQAQRNTNTPPSPSLARKPLAPARTWNSTPRDLGGEELGKLKGWPRASAKLGELKELPRASTAPAPQKQVAINPPLAPQQTAFRPPQTSQNENARPSNQGRSGRFSGDLEELHARALALTTNNENKKKLSLSNDNNVRPQDARAWLKGLGRN